MSDNAPGVDYTPVFLSHAEVYAAAFDPERLPLEENFNPDDADPSGRITCLGPLPPWRLPAFRAFDPNLFTLQQLCAKPQYGGRAMYQHIGGWCDADRSVPGSAGRERAALVVFDSHPRARTSQVLLRPRLALYCSMRCHCDLNANGGDLSVQPRALPQETTLHSDRDGHAYRIKLDVFDDYKRFVEHRGSLGSSPARAIGLASPLLASDVESVRPSDGNDLVGLEDANQVECSGDLPDHPLPSPMRYQDYENLTQLCAVHLSGGLGAANAGAFCHGNIDGQRDVRFANEMTPRIEWTLPQWNQLQTRFHCWFNCYCRGNGSPWGKKPRPRWRMRENLDIVERPDGSVDAEVLPYPESGSSTPSVKNVASAPGAGQSRTLRRCGADGRQFCRIPDPASLPAAPPAASLPEHSRPAAAAAAEPYPQCGARCTSNRDCRGADPSAAGCRCVAADVETARTAGLDPVFPGAVCLLVTAALSNRPFKANPLGGRSPSDVPAIACACNATYVSRGCCDSDDGMIWEAPSLKLGNLIDGVRA
ncbi:MAG: hypothetical protein M1817_006119 [Caeruleum heppii]|nr:MAG: hypothetical protein M1817_006119 [Caeruleum heppii]